MRSTIATAAALTVLCTASCRAPARPPHIVLISADALRADHLSGAGYPRATSPNLDRFAATAWNFTDAITVLPKTGPSFATIFSGLHPEQHGVTANRYRIPPGVPLLAERLRAHGYATAAFVTNPELAAARGYARGFEVYQLPDDDGGAEPVRSVERWATAADWSRPTFVWIHFIDPHGPYTPPPAYAALFADDDIARADPRRLPLDYEPLPDFPDAYVLGAVPHYQQIGREDRVAAYVSRYDAEIRYLDDRFARLEALLRDAGVWDAAAVVFVSDHGEGMGEHDYFFEHGWFADEAGLRVPLLVKLPGQTAGRRTERQVTNLDLLPMLLTLARIAPPPGLPGRDPLADDPATRPAVVTNCSTYPVRDAGLRDGRWKYLRDVTASSDWTASDGHAREELYDLAADRGETRNLAADRADLVREMRTRFAEEGRRLRAERAPATPDTPAPDPALRERLRELGYLD
jgi:arylsulfatase A-like enzyme